MIKSISKNSRQLKKGCQKTVIVPNYIDINNHNYNDNIDKAYGTMKSYIWTFMPVS